MKELFSTARNIRHNLVEGVIVPEIEAVLSVYERHVEFVGAGTAQIERCETLRFSLGPKVARKLAGHLMDWADEAEQQAARLSVAKEPVVAE